MRDRVVTPKVLLVTLALVACGPPGADVADLSVVIDLPKEVGPGGFASTVQEDGFATGYFYKEPILDCGVRVVEAARAWAGTHGFTEAEAQASARMANVRLLPAEPSAGAVLIRYFLASDNSLGRVQITYQAGPDGETPSQGELVAMGMPELVEAELAAAQCESEG
jgi:hypothetical protein